MEKKKEWPKEWPKQPKYTISSNYTHREMEYMNMPEPPQLRSLIDRDSKEWRSDIRILVSDSITHPVMQHLKEVCRTLVIVDTDKLNMADLYVKLQAEKEEYQRNEGLINANVTMTYSKSECCGHTLIIRLKGEEIHIRYQEMKRRGY